MKSLVKPFVIAAGIAFWSAPCFSAYLIEFKSGAQFITGDYWEEGQKIWFHQAGGFVGIEKHLVREIRESEIAELVREKAAPTHPPRKTGPVAVKAPSAPERPQEAGIGQHSSSALPSATAPAKDIEIEKEFDSLKQRVASADPLEKTELISLAKDMTAFRNKVLKKNLGHVYTDRLLELSTMFDRVERLIKSRG